MKRYRQLTLTFGAFAAAAALIAWLIYPSYALRSPAEAPFSGAHSDQMATNDVNGQYTGAVNLRWVAAGVYSDTLTPPASSPGVMDSLGPIDLALELSQAGSAVSGYVLLDRTLVFTREHTVGGLDVGPYVVGSFDGTNLKLRSERFSLLAAGQRMLREFALDGAIVGGQTSRIEGEYRETLWGFAPRPLTIVGEFELNQPAFALPPPSGPQLPLFLPLMRRE